MIRTPNVTVSVTSDSPTLDRWGLRKRRVSVEQSDFVDSDSSTSSPANSTQSEISLMTISYACRKDLLKCDCGNLNLFFLGSPAKRASSAFPGPTNSPSSPGSTPGSAGGSVSPSPDHRCKQSLPQNDQNSLQILNTRERALDQVS